MDFLYVNEERMARVELAIRFYDEILSPDFKNISPEQFKESMAAFKEAEVDHLGVDFNLDDLWVG